MSTSVNGSPAAPTPPTTSKRAGQLPSNAVALAKLGLDAADEWLKSEELPALLWLSKAEFKQLATNFDKHRDTADAAGDQRTPQSRRLKELDKQINKSVKYVKAYLAEAYDEDEGQAYYAEFGLELVNKTYALPKARPERVKALGKLLLALKAHKFDKNKYGTAYWQPLATEYAALVTDSTETTGQRSGTVSVKDQSKAKLRKALQALVHHIKANYPDTFEAVLRTYGFQKENY